VPTGTAATRRPSRRLWIRLLELGTILGAFSAPHVAVWLTDVPNYVRLFVLVSSIPGVLILSGILAYYLPTRCWVEGARVVMKTPSRTIIAVMEEEPSRERGGLIPPKRTKAMFCYGWRFLTLYSDCGDEFFFSTPNCDGSWLVAKARIGQERKNLWICGCKS